VSGRVWLWVLGLGVAAIVAGWYLEVTSSERLELCKSLIGAAEGGSSAQAVALDCYLNATSSKKLGTFIFFLGLAATAAALLAAYRQGRQTRAPGE
jgi:hypothetical protein